MTGEGSAREVGNARHYEQEVCHSGLAEESPVLRVEIPRQARDDKIT